ncbi:MAG: cobalamin-dependent protein [Thermoleophilia bacterium]|nr:cobalamin-dependent protein [Thermoleophilia bacterium]
MDSQLTTAVADLDEDSVFEILRAELDAGTAPSTLLGLAREGMTIVGERFESGEYYLSDLIMSGELFKEIAQMIVGETASDGTGQPRATVVIATVEGDVHDIGKDIVVNLLRGANYQVVDLGVNVPAAKVAEAVRESQATVVGLSGLLTIAFDPMKQTVEAVRALGLPVKIMVGGAPVTEAVREYVGADARGADALDAVKIADEWTSVAGSGL